MTRTATPGQIDYMAKLQDERGVYLDTFQGVTVDPDTFPFSMVTPVLDYLKSLPKVMGPVAVKAAREELTDGMYQTPDGTIYKLQFAVNGSGYLYGKRLMVEENEDNPGQTDVWFERDTTAIRRLTLADKMSQEAARAFGQLYGVCCLCGRTLTDEESIARGTGKVCDGRM